MTARDDYRTLARVEARNQPNPGDPPSDTVLELAAILDEVDRLRAVIATIELN